ncbi:preprotein translocase subunit SecA [candidate division CPR3 bacterium 4484_211]|uniref:Protein translocase subunit SecA n=1 Tax=candidate division CPR3 bacterium 4484_211 TaxID=1968527 RepID=A0A1W9NWV1_UNCC3|nr:MAG: preprotein translocase subunit SecA [candidate division CPR3 bacterium 4484_211]
MLKILSRLFNSNEKQIAKLSPWVQQINSLEKSTQSLSNEALKRKTDEFKNLLAQGKTLEEILPQAFAVVREAAKRTVGLRPYDVQLMAGIVLHQGKIAEQKTGEGKTLSAVMPLYLNALTGKGAHLVTVNDYLARRDTEWMGPVYSLLGLSVGCLNHEKSFLYQAPELNSKSPASPAGGRPPVSTQKESLLGKGQFLREVSRREAYAADITYGTNNEFGFDYLRDNMVSSLDQMVQVCPRNEIGIHHYAIVDEVDFLLIDQARTPLIISAPQQKSNDLYIKFAKLVPQLLPEYYEVDEKRKTVTLTELGVAKIEKMLQVDNLYADFSLAHHLEQAIKAYKLFQRDRDYIVKDGRVIIVDEFTGRLMPGRRYSEGLHQAIEAKEGVPIQKESKTLATISFQNYFRMYQKLAGMTGTAVTEAEEFSKIYQLPVVAIPTNKPVVRVDLPDQIYKHQRAKYSAVLKEIEEKHQKGQPVLVGTTSVEKNELVSKLLKRRHIPHKILNAKNHQKEAEIIAQAGQRGAVTVATNLAGRGTDIKLGEGVKELGGLHVIGTERHEARRIDNQLRGRAGRQGDPGSSRFFVALDDDLMRVFGGDRIAKMMERFNFPEDLPIEHPLITKSLETAQKKVESYNFDIRKHLVEYDDVINKQREIIYRLRRKILEKKSLKETILKKLAGKNKNSASQISPKPSSEESSAQKAYLAKEQELGPETMRKLERAIYLSTLDQLWMDHIDAIDELRRGIQLRGYAQKDPLVEFKNEAFSMFKQLMERINTEAVERILKVEIIPQVQSTPAITLKNLSLHQDTPIPSPAPVSTSPSTKPSSKKVGRNDPCPCGSGKKYKHCCGKNK